jgi:hypothetical protein
MGDCYMLRDIQAQDAPEDTEAKKPEVDRNACHEAQHGRHGYLQSRSIHSPYYGLAGDRRKEHVQGLDENAGGRNGTCFTRPRTTSPAPQKRQGCPTIARPISAYWRKRGSRFRIGRKGSRRRDFLGVRIGAFFDPVVIRRKRSCRIGRGFVQAGRLPFRPQIFIPRQTIHHDECDNHAPRVEHGDRPCSPTGA